MNLVINRPQILERQGFEVYYYKEINSYHNN